MKTLELFSQITEIFGADFLTQANCVDKKANGIQVKGTEDVDTVALGVSCNLEFLEKAVKLGAQVCLFHHGLPLDDSYIVNSRLPFSVQKELAFALHHNLTIAGYHFALDAHPVIGNNAVIIEKLKARFTGEAYCDGWGWIGEYETPVFLEDIAKEAASLFRHDIFIVKGKPGKVKRIGVCSGGAVPKGKELFEIENKGIDLHITGEIREHTPSLAKQSGFSYFAVGHYASEVFGIQALQLRLQQKNPQVRLEFIEMKNPL